MFFTEPRTLDIRNITGSRARFVERFIRHGTTKERENAIEVQVHKNQKQAHDGDGGLSSRMQVIESLDVFSGAYEDVLRACENLGKCYEDMKDSGNLSALSNELEAIEEDFTELEGRVRGYLSNASNSSVKERTEQLKEEVSKREVELSRIE